ADGGGAGILVDDLGRTGVVAGRGREVAVAVVGGGDRVGGHRKGRGGEGGLSGGHGHGVGQGDGAFLEGDGARGRARTRRDRSDDGGEGDRLAKDRRVGGRADSGGAGVLVDYLGGAGVGACAGREVAVAVVGCGDRM